MLIEMSELERRELEEVLRQHLQTLLNELAHADDRAYRRELRQRYDRLEQLQRRLSLPGQPEAPGR
jgi:hypothetical protein